MGTIINQQLKVLTVQLVITISEKVVVLHNRNLSHIEKLAFDLQDRSEKLKANERYVFSRLGKLLL